MNLSELSSPGAAIAVVAVLLMAAGCLFWLVGRRWMVAMNRLAHIESDVAVYSEASTRVARTLEEMLLARSKPGMTVHSSRRYLLQTARERISQGESVKTLQRSLGLSFDEVRLLERGETMALSQRPGNPAFTDAGSPDP